MLLLFGTKPFRVPSCLARKRPRRLMYAPRKSRAAFFVGSYPARLFVW